MRVPHGCAGSPLPEGTRIRRPLGPSGINPPARPARGGRCARRLETRPSVAVPQGSPADPGADRRRRRGLPLSYRIHRHDRARRADDDADARRVRGIRAGDGEGAHPGRPQSGPRARAPWRATAEVHSGATRGNPQHARRRPIGGRGRPIVPGAPRDGQPAQRCVASNRGSLNCPVHATFGNLAENRPTVYSGHEREERCCGSCGAARHVKGHRPLTCRTVFGSVQVEALRLRRCGCGEDSVAGDRASFSPVADLLPERTTPELLYLETRWGSLVSYGLAARMLGDVLPLGKPVAPERVRRHLHAVAVREEATLGDEVDGAMWSGCQRDLDELPLPDGPAYVGVDGGFVRDRAGSWFEVIAGKLIPGFCRDAPEDEEPRPARCFAFVQTHDDRPRRRLLDVLVSQGYAPNQRVVLMSDGGESVRRLVSRIGPEAEHVLDWFHVTMRLTVLVQMTKGACPDPGGIERRLADLERLKWLLWHGHAGHAVEAAEGFAADAWCIEEEASGEARAKPARLRAAAE